MNNVVTYEEMLVQPIPDQLIEKDEGGGCAAGGGIVLLVIVLIVAAAITAIKNS